MQFLKMKEREGYYIYKYIFIFFYWSNVKSNKRANASNSMSIRKIIKLDLKII